MPDYSEWVQILWALLIIFIAVNEALKSTPKQKKQKKQKKNDIPFTHQKPGLFRRNRR